MALSDAAALATTDVGSMWAAGRLGALIPQLPVVLWLTSIVLIVIQVSAIKKIQVGAMLGNYLLLQFLSTNGAM